MDLAGNAFNGAVVAACLTALAMVAPWPEIFEQDCEGSSCDAGEGEACEEESPVADAIDPAVCCGNCREAECEVGASAVCLGNRTLASSVVEATGGEEEQKGMSAAL